MFVRKFIGADLDSVAIENASKVITFELSVGFFWEPYWQDWAVESSRNFLVFLNWSYIFSFFPILLITSVIVYIKDRQKYHYYRNVVLLSFILALTVFAIFPLAPPRFMPEYGFVDAIARYGPTWYASREAAVYYNAFAAMPSLHFGWSVLFGVLFFRTGRFPLQVWGVIYPTLTFFAIIFMSFYDEFVAEAIDVGANGYLTKDVSGARLVTAIRDLYYGGRVLDVSAMAKTSHIDDWSSDPDIQEAPDAEPPAQTPPMQVAEIEPVLTSPRIPVDLVIPPSSNSSMVLQLLDRLGQHLKSIILEVGGSPMSGTVVKILPNNPSSFRDELLALEQISTVTATSNEMALASADGASTDSVSFTFHVELNDPDKKGPLHMAEWPNLAWASAAKKPPENAITQKGWFWAS